MANTVLADRYELLDHLGSGGMARVWRGRDRRLNREVAVKVLSEELAAEGGFKERFEREAMHVASLKHPNIVTVYDCGSEDDTYYIVMELVEGQSLQARLEATQPYLAVDLAVRLGAEALAGLAHAHSRGIIHRDVKPANILITGEDTAKLADFGIARSAGDAGGLTTTGSFLGTPSYSSPEQLTGLPPTAATDQYSLGSVLYQCLAGRPPFEAEIPAGVVAQHLQAQPRSIRQYRPEVPLPIERTVLRALEKEPDNRFGSAAEMRDALVGGSGQEGPRRRHASSTVVTPGQTAGEGRRRSRLEKVALLSLPVALLAVYLLVAVAAKLPPFSSSSPPRPVATRSQTSASTVAPAPAGAPVGTVVDSCLVGRWTIQSATFPFEVSVSGQSVPLTGGKGATTTFTSGGSMTYDFGSSAPFLGSLNGQTINVSLRGTASLGVSAAQGTLNVLQGTTSGISGTVSTSSGLHTTFQGTPLVGTTFSYSCGKTNLGINTPGETFALTRP